MQQIHNRSKELSKENLHQIKVKTSEFLLPAVLGLSLLKRRWWGDSRAAGSAIGTRKQTQEEGKGRDRVLMVRGEKGRQAKVNFEDSRVSGEEEEKGIRGGKRSGRGKRERDSRRSGRRK